MRRLVHPIVLTLCLLLLSGCAASVTVEDTASLSEDQSELAVEDGAVQWCEGPAVLVQDALTESLGKRHSTPGGLELSFRRMLATLQAAESDAPAELDITMSSAIENLQDLIQLLEEFEWELSFVDEGRFNRIDGRFEGAVLVVDEFAVRECGLDSGFNSPVALEDDDIDWCAGTVSEIQLGIIEAATVDTNNPAAFEQAYVDLALFLRVVGARVPSELEVIMVVTIENLNDTVGYLAENDWVLDDTNQFEWGQLNYDLEDAFYRLDEYNLFECGVETSLALPILEHDDEFFPPDDIPEPLEPLPPVDEPEAPDDDDPNVETVTESPVTHVSEWRFITSTPQLGVGDRLSELAPFPTSHVVPATSISTLFVDYVPQGGTGDLNVLLEYRSALDIRTTVELVTEAMSQEDGSVVINETDDGSFLVESAPFGVTDPDGSAIHEVIFIDAGDGETNVMARFSVTMATFELDRRMQEITRHRNDGWPEPTGAWFGFSSASYEWSIDSGISVQSVSDHFFDDAPAGTLLEFFREGRIRSTIEWQERELDDGLILLITPDEVSCVLVFPNSVSYFYEYDDDVGDSSCEP